MKGKRKNKITGLIDFHTHSLLSDGVLLPSELVRRYEVAGFNAVAITDHVDSSNIDSVISSIVRVCRELNRYWKIKAIPGVELTHIPIQQFLPFTRYARKNGAKIVVAHGETITEPVIKGTNRAAIEAGVDLLAHPGKISNEDARLATKRAVFLEITTRKGHSATNAHVALIAKETTAKIILSSDSHSPDDIPTKQLFDRTAKSAGLSDNNIIHTYTNSKTLFKRIISLT